MAILKLRPKKGKKAPKEKHISEILEEKWVGTRSEIFALIQAKEAEIRKKTNQERSRAERIIEDAKGEAAAIKRKATLEDIGRDVYDRIIASAREEAEKLERSTAEEVERVKKEGERNLPKAVDFIVESVILASPADRE
jgi:flagellar biosynthesis/type III secretory pathway protein FliH